jgi:hypothetical protein
MQEKTMFDMQAHYHEYSKIRSAINTLPWESKEDFQRMLLTLEKLVSHIMKEQVTCRQRRKVTRDYGQLLNLYQKHKENLEHQLLLAVLSV